MTGLKLAHPLWLVALLAVAVVLWIAGRRRARSTLLYSSVALLRGAPASFAQRLHRLLPAVRFVALAAICLALARPQHGLEEFRVRTEGIAIMMAIDKSGSMMAMDFELDDKRVNRLEVVKSVFREFVAGSEQSKGRGGARLAGRPDDKIGLVAFGGFAEDRCPLTLDHGALLSVLDQVKIPEPTFDRAGNVQNEALLQEELSTAIGDALALGVERLKGAPDKSKVLILLSDGKNESGIIDPMQAAEAAKTLGVKIYTIGVGSNRPVPFPARDPFGRISYEPRIVPMDEELLKEIAATTGGRYFNAQDTETLEKVYARIDELERTVGEGVIYTDWQELYRWLLLPALGLFVGELLLAATRLRTMP